MKLYKIIVLHGAPKSSHTSTEEYILRENDKEVFEYIRLNYTTFLWENSEDFETYEFEDYNDFKKDIMENKGDLEHESGWDDAYYGVTKYGWEDMGEITDDDINVLKKLGILK